MYSALKNFLLSNEREKEESFARFFTNNKKIKLKFDIENKSASFNYITETITINPAIENMYQAKRAFEISLVTSKLPYIEYSEAKALKLIVRGLNIHECLHSINTNPYIKEANDLKENEIKILKILHNIVEDIFIERTAIKDYKGLNKYIIFNCSYLEQFKIKNKKKLSVLEEYLTYINRYYRYNYNKSLKKVNRLHLKLKDFLKRAILEKNPTKRNYYTFKLYEELKKHLKKDEFIVNEENFEECGGISKEKMKKSKSKALKGNYEFLENELIRELNESFEIDDGHDNISLNLFKFDNKEKLTKEEYDNLLSNVKKKYKRVYDSFKNIMQEYDYEIETKKIIGHYIDSNKLVDHKKRFWKNKYEDKKIIDFSVMILIDASASMRTYLNEIKEILVFLNDIFTKYKIKHSIVSHNAIFHENDVNIFFHWDYDSKQNEKYNIVKYSPNNGTRDGIVLRYINRYIDNKKNLENPILFIISDGDPFHINKDLKCYSTPYCIDDIKDSLKDLKKSGIKIYPIAFNNSFEDLSKIYDRLYICDTPNKLINNLFKIIAKHLKK